MTERIPVTIWGATGFAGAELLRIFARHPHFEVIGAVSRSKAGTSVGAVHPHLRHVYNDLTFISPEDAASLSAAAAFLALPHRASAIDNLMKGAAGSAVQCANLMFGLPETEGLDMMPVYPA